MYKLVEFGDVKWTRQDLVDALGEFSLLYEQRPIRENTGGMSITHLFLSWFVLKALQPRHVVESGVFQGFGTWFLEQAVPDAQLYCIDLDYSQLVYRSPRAHYFNQDFATLDWQHLSPQETLLFFDDHQNAYERIKTVKWFGFRHAMFEDNFPPGHGDCYSLKMAFAESGFEPAVGRLRHRVKLAVTGMFGGERLLPIPPNTTDARYLYQNLEAYQELPPVYRAIKNRWGEDWNDATFPTPAPLLSDVTADYQAAFQASAQEYHSLCYVRLKP